MRRRLLIAGWITLIGFPLSGWLLLKWLSDYSAETMWRGPMHIGLQLVYGAAVGFAIGYLAKALVSRPFMQKVQQKYARVIGNLNMRSRDIIFLSICAGFGEELLFRGAVQPLIGIWPTAIAFVALHGYLSPFSWRITVYGIYMTLAIAFLGYMAEAWGVLSACMAHTAIDIILFQHLTEKSKTPAHVPYEIYNE